MKMHHTALAVALALASSAAMAIPSNPYPDNGSVNNGPLDFVGGYTATFSDNIPTGYTSFDDFWDFQIPSYASNSGGASVVVGLQSHFLQNAKLTSFNLWDGNTLVAQGQFIGTAIAGLNYSVFSMNDTYTLEVAGNIVNTNVGGSYSGNVSVDPVPEPSEWALMASGLGIMGFIATRRSKKAA